MILGIGLDLVEVDRIERAMENPRFVERVLTAKEQLIIRTPEGVAGRWAAKEAIAKAVGLEISWQEIEILNGAQGAPEVTILKEGFDLSTRKIHLSITHERGNAAAVAILEGV